MSGGSLNHRYQYPPARAVSSLTHGHFSGRGVARASTDDLLSAMAAGGSLLEQRAGCWVKRAKKKPSTRRTENAGHA